MSTMGMPYGLQAMLKEGYKHFQGVDEAILKNIEACRGLSMMIRTSLGPNGMNKVLVNHLEKIFVTSDASTILRELEVEHPAAKLLAMAAKAQDLEIGDGTSLVAAFGGELLHQAEELLRDGLTTVEVSDGYEFAAKKAVELLEGMVIPGTEELDCRNKEQVAERLQACICSKQMGLESVLCPLVAEACISVLPKNPQNFDVDSVRIAKISGGSIYDSQVVHGMVFKRDAEGTVKRIEDGLVAVYSQGIDTSSTETKGTVLIKSAEELKSYAHSEEDKMEANIKAIADAGVKCVVSGQAVGEMALHFIEKYGMMCIRIPSKFELNRFCRATGATSLVKLVEPQKQDLGFAKSVKVEEVGGTRCIVVRQEAALAGKIATVVLRSNTQSFLDDVERAIDDAVNTYKAMCKSPSAVPGGSATEIELSRQLSSFAKTRTGLDQYAIQKFAEALLVVPRVMADNCGLDSTATISALMGAHEAGDTAAGLDMATGKPRNLAEDGITDLLTTKWWALHLAARAAVTILRVDHIVMAKAAGGPQPRGPGGMDED